jgi:hypothetical protein
MPRPRKQLSEAQQIALDAKRLMVADRVAGVRARKRVEQEEVAKAGMTTEEILEYLRPTREAMENYRRIQEGKTFRGSMSTLSAMNKALDILLPKPKQEMGFEGGVEVVVRSLGGAATAARLESAPATTPEKQTYTLPATATVVHAETGTYTTVTAEGDTCES